MYRRNNAAWLNRDSYRLEEREMSIWREIIIESGTMSVTIFSCFGIVVARFNDGIIQCAALLRRHRFESLEICSRFCLRVHDLVSDSFRLVTCHTNRTPWMCFRLACIGRTRTLLIAIWLYAINRIYLTLSNGRLIIRVTFCDSTW